MKFKATKSLGQNFLKTTDIPALMVKSIDIKDNDHIIEIGGGQGAVTKILSDIDNNFKLDIYEIDKRFIKTLEEIKYKKGIVAKIYNEDFLKVNLSEIYNKRKIKVIGSIPYYITSPIIHSLLKMEEQPKVITLLMQKEVAEKIIQETPKANYWSSLTTMYERKILKIVSKEAFDPIPNVNSAILQMTLKEKDFPIPIQKWSKFLHLAYKNPRKMLNKTFDPKILETANINPSMRPQNITAKKWIKLYDIINNVK